MADQDTLISTVAAASPEAVTSLDAATQAAAADASILVSEIQDSIQGLLASLASNQAISEDDPIKQLAEASPAVAAFVAKLQESIVDAKEGSTQGLMLAQQLKDNVITLEQFNSGVAAINLTPAQLQAAVAVDLPSETQKLILALASDGELKKIEGILTTETTPEAFFQLAQNESGFDENDQAESLETLEALIEAVAAGDLTQEQVEGEFITKTLAKIAKSDTFSDTQKAKLKAQIAAFFQLTLSKLGTVAKLVIAAQYGMLKAKISKFSATSLKKLVKTAELKSPGKLDALASKNPGLPVETAKKVTTEFKDEKLSFLQNLFAVAKAIAEQNIKASKSSLIGLKQQPRIMTGARAVLRVNNKVVALCNNVQYEVSTEWQEIRGIDELLPNDLAPTSFSVKGSMSIFRVPSKSPVGDFTQQDMFRGIIWPLTTIEIRDKRTDELIMLVKRAAITSRSESFTKNQLTSTNLSFVGIGFRDEQMPELLPDKLGGDSDGNGGFADAFVALTNKIF